MSTTPTYESPCGCELTEEEVKTVWGRYCLARGGGRPRSGDRCACGAMTKKRAMARGHKCPVPVKRGKPK